MTPDVAAMFALDADTRVAFFNLSFVGQKQRSSAF